MLKRDLISERHVGFLELAGFEGRADQRGRRNIRDFNKDGAASEVN